MRLSFLFLLFSMTGYGQIFELEVVSSTGGSGTIPGYSLDWTVGEVEIEMYTSASNTLTQGFHQPAYCVGQVSIREWDLLNLNAYPNPVSNELYLEISDYNEEVEIQISNLLGQVLRTKSSLGNAPLKIDMTELAAGKYILSILSETEVIKSTTIIKQ